MAQKLKKRWLVLIACGLIFYGLLWWLTHAIGVPQTRKVAVDPFVSASFTDVTADKNQRASGPVYYCRAAAWAPFIVRVHYAWTRSPLEGDGGKVLYLWFFGRSVRVWRYEHWMN